MPSKIKKGDSVIILSGKDKGQGGKVLRVFPKDDLLLIEGMNIRKRHRRARKAGEKGSIIQMPTPLSVSKVMIKCPSCQKPTRVGIKDEGGERKRFCKKCKVEF